MKHCICINCKEVYDEKNALSDDTFGVCPICLNLYKIKRDLQKAIDKTKDKTKQKSLNAEIAHLNWLLKEREKNPYNWD